MVAVANVPRLWVGLLFHGANDFPSLPPPLSRLYISSPVHFSMPYDGTKSAVRMIRMRKETDGFAVMEFGQQPDLLRRVRRIREEIGTRWGGWKAFWAFGPFVPSGRRCHLLAASKDSANAWVPTHGIARGTKKDPLPVDTGRRSQTTRAPSDYGNSAIMVNGTSRFD